MTRKTKGKRKTKIWFILGVLLCCGGLAQATPVDVNFYSNATIGNGDEYGTVNIYDSLDVPPIQTTVTMTGGDIEYCNLYNTSNLNFSGGDILLITTYNDSSIIADAETSPGYELRNNSKAYLNNGSNITNVQIFDSAELHVYGYNLYYDETPAPNWITGQWENGQGFQILLRNIYSYDPEQVFLHEIPEPCMIGLFGIGFLILKKRTKTFTGNAERKKMKATICFILGVLLWCGGLTQAVPSDVNVYGGDFLIEDGDYYDYVNIFNDANVLMTGGEAVFLQAYNTSSINYSNGHAWNIYLNNYATANVSTHECQSFELNNFGKMYIENGPTAANLFTYDDSEFHIYGYNLSLDPNTAPQITGNWEDGRAFQIYIRDAGSIVPEDHIFFHDIPEPLSLFLFGLSALIIGRKSKTSF